MKECKEKQNASLTVEAALTLPIIFMTCYVFLYFFYIIDVQEQIHNSAGQACESIASMGYVMRYLTESDQKEAKAQETSEGKAVGSNESNAARNNEGNVEQNNESNVGDFLDDLGEDDIKPLLLSLTDAILIKSYVKKYISDENNVSRVVVNGWDGVSFLGSNLYDEEEFVTIIMSYKIHFPVFESILPDFSVVQCVRMHSFNGRVIEVPEQDTRGDMVYVAENGNVYHTHEDCSYIKIVVHSVRYSQIASKRNDSGGKYYSCESCFSSRVLSQIREENGEVFITSDGTRYHSSSECSKIKRSVSKVSIDEVEGKRKCSKCASRDGESVKRNSKLSQNNS